MSPQLQWSAPAPFTRGTVLGFHTDPNFPPFYLVPCLGRRKRLNIQANFNTTTTSYKPCHHQKTWLTPILVPIQVSLSTSWQKYGLIYNVNRKEIVWKKMYYDAMLEKSYIFYHHEKVLINFEISMIINAEKKCPVLKKNLSISCEKSS